MLRRGIAQVSSLPFASASAMVFPTSVLPNAGANLVIANDHHRSIVDAVAQRQGARAESVAREHAFVARRVLAVALSDTDGLSRIPGGPLIHVSVK
jgi:GntR family transcriptional regulator of vanillate catabolism